MKWVGSSWILFLDAQALPHRRHPESAMGWWWAVMAGAAESAADPKNWEPEKPTETHHLNASQVDWMPTPSWMGIPATELIPLEVKHLLRGSGSTKTTSENTRSLATQTTTAASEHRCCGNKKIALILFQRNESVKRNRRGKQILTTKKQKNMHVDVFWRLLEVRNLSWAEIITMQPYATPKPGRVDATHGEFSKWPRVVQCHQSERHPSNTWWHTAPLWSRAKPWKTLRLVATRTLRWWWWRLWLLLFIGSCCCCDNTQN